MQNPRLELLLERAGIAESRGRYDTAIEAYREALRVAPASAAANVNFAGLLGSLGRFEEALPLCRRAVEVDPRSVAARLNLASTLAELRRLDEAVECFSAARSLAPGDPALALDLADCLVMGGRVDEAVPILRQILREHPQAAVAHCSLLLALNYCTESAAQLGSEHRRFDDTFGITAGSALPVARKDVGTRIRIGLVSGDLHRHSVAYFLAPWFDHYDRTQFHLTCYATGRVVDSLSEWLRSRADAWLECFGISDAALDERIRRDRNDVLVDLGGHTASGRPIVFARRPAPVQISFLGYPMATGLSAIGFRLSDRVVDPPEAVAAGPERILRMPDSYFCYRPPLQGPAIAPLPMLQTGRPTFGCFNVLAKISDSTLAVWAAVLAALPTSRLLLKAQGLNSSAARSRVLARCARAGMDPGQIELMDWEKNIESHLACYARVDAALDTFPYNGATTTCEALWMGVPVVSLSGETAASRMGTSILHAAGRGAWVVRDRRDFVATCVGLVSDPHSLAAERAGLRSTLAASALMDEVRYVRALEGLLKDSLAQV